MMTVPRTVATSAAWGFLAGALFACAVMWGYGDAIESLAARVRLAPASGALDRWNGAIAAPTRRGSWSHIRLRGVGAR